MNQIQEKCEIVRTVFDKTTKVVAAGIALTVALSDLLYFVQSIKNKSN